MSNAVLIIGESGTGKSTSIRTLPPEQTFIINVLGKPLPFRGAKGKFKKVSTDNEGNYFSSDNHDKIKDAINYVNLKRPDIKYLVIDDFGYTITNTFMREAKKPGYQKFTDLASDAWEILKTVNSLRDSLFSFLIMHSDTDQFGKSKPKTIGKLLDEKVCIEGMYTHVLHSIVKDRNYMFITNNDGAHMAKMPMGMFPSLLIPNDLKLVADAMTAYYEGTETETNGDIPQ